MVEKKLVTRAQLDAITAGLSKLKKKEEERLGLKAAIGYLSPTITAVLAKGFSYLEIAEILRREYEIEIKPATLSSYHRNALGADGTAPKSNGGRRTHRVSDAQPSDTKLDSAVISEPGSPRTLSSKFIQDPEL